MTTYRYLGNLHATDRTEGVYVCPTCGGVVSSQGTAVHDAYHAKVDGMFRALDHLMRIPDGSG
jgi:hypothetical protein